MEDQVVKSLQSFQKYVDGFTFEEAPLSSFVVPVTGAVVYLTTIFLLRTNVKSRYRLKLFAVLHNLFLCLLSLLMFVGCLTHILRFALLKNWFNVMCDELVHDMPMYRGGLTFWCYIFYVSKFYEMLDTVVMVLKARPLTFIHVYHHCIVPFLFWAFLFTDSTAHWILVVNNSGVHVIMYFYFMIHEQGFIVWWKKYLTITQIIQFFVDMMATWPHVITMFYFTPAYTGWSCWGSMPAVVFGQCVGLSFIYLFTSFYFNTYRKDASVMTQFQSVEEQMAARSKHE